MSAQTRESRPGGDRAAVSEVVLPGGANGSIVPSAPDADHGHAPCLTPELVHRVVTGALSAVVVRLDAAGRVSRRSFLTLAAAERAVDRARARGGQAAVSLVRLVPVGGDPRDRVPGEVRRDDAGRLVSNALPEAVVSW